MVFLRQRPSTWRRSLDWRPDWTGLTAGAPPDRRLQRLGSLAAVLAGIAIALASYWTAGGTSDTVLDGSTLPHRYTVSVSSSVSSSRALWLSATGFDSDVRAATSAPSDRNALSALADVPPRQLFITGYDDFEGPAYWADHFTHNVLPCESKQWGTWYANGFVTKAQFTHRSWSIASSRTGLDDPGNPYHVGAAVAVWTNILLNDGSHPGSSAGWPVCFWE